MLKSTRVLKRKLQDLIEKEHLFFSDTSPVQTKPKEEETQTQTHTHTHVGYKQL